MTEEQVFLAALDQPDAAARAAYLDESCGVDTDLRRQVEALLASHDKSGEFLDVPAAEQVQTDSGNLKTVVLPRDPMSADQNPDDDSDGLHFLTPSTRPDSLGRIGHYEVLQVFGKGGFGIVFRAFDDVLQRVVAIKVLAPELAVTSPARKRFLREARMSAKVRHENVVQVYEVSESPLPYLVMEFIPGETLQQRLDRSGPLETVEVVKLGRQIAAGLAAAHETGLIHRDIKPANILIEGGPNERVKITDFGLARTADDASMTQSGVVAGTPTFMAPEQARGETLDHRADLFSLGSVLYTMCVGHPPFRASTTFAVLKRVAEDEPRPIREVIPEVPEWLCDLISKLHAKNPDDRFQTAAEVAQLFEHVAHQQNPDKISLPATALLAAAAEKPVSAESRSDPEMRPLMVPAGPRWPLLIATGIMFLVAALLLVVTESTGITRLFSRVADVTSPPVPPKPGPLAGEFEAGEWVQLFNRKDLTGWKTHPEQPGDWQVQNGILIGTMRQSHLFTTRDDFANFHLRAVMKINQGGDSGIRFRVPFRLLHGEKAWQVIPAGGYEAEFNRFPNASAGSGSVWRVNAASAPNTLFRTVDPLSTPPDQWVTYEVIADGNRFTTKIDGREVASCSDPDNLHTRGQIALQCFSSRTIVQFSKLEIKELPPSETGFVPLWSGQDLQGWEVTDPKKATIVDKTLVLTAPCEAGPKADYRDFHLRFESKVNQGTDGTAAVSVRWVDKDFGVGGGAASNNARFPTGVLYFGQAGKVRRFGRPNRGLASADTWCRMEVIARGKHIVVKVNGETTAEAILAEVASAGRIVLAAQDHSRPGTVVHFRKIEIKELPPESGFVPLFNEKDLTGWKSSLNDNIEWTWAEGVLTAKGLNALLSTERNDYENFHLRMAIKNKPGSSVWVRLRDVGGRDVGGNDGGNYLTTIRPTPGSDRLMGGGLSVSPLNEKQRGLAHNADVGLPDVWHTLEVIAEGNRLRTLVDGKPAADVIDPDHTRSRGVIALSLFGRTPQEVHFKNVEIKELPATADSKPIQLRSFTPGKDKLPVALRPEGKEVVTVDGDAWRIENSGQGGNFNVLIAQVLDDIPQEGVLVLRAKVRVEAKDKLASGSLGFGGANQVFIDWDQWPAALARYDAKDTEWVEKEVRHLVSECRKTDPPAIYLYAGLHANGVVWLKDVTLLHLPAAKTATTDSGILEPEVAPSPAND